MPYIYKPITTIQNSAPARIVCPAHGLPDKWRVAVLSAQGLTSLNSLNIPPKNKDFREATVIDADTIEFNAKITLEDPAHTASTGYLVYLSPVDLSAYTSARMQVKTAVGGTEILLLTTANGRVTLDTTNKKVVLSVDADTLSAITQDTGVYDLELVTAAGIVDPLISGVATFCDEVTTAV